MRDLETIAIAIETAETGHLVFGTLHTTTAASTVDRVIDQFPADRQAQIRVMLSESLKGVIAQTLCRKIGGGRVAALEVLIATGAISNLIREGKTFQIPSMMQVGKAVGMVTLNDALLDLVTKKLVAPEEAYAKCVDKAGFEAALKRADVDTRIFRGSLITAKPDHVERLWTAPDGTTCMLVTWTRRRVLGHARPRRAGAARAPPLRPRQRPNGRRRLVGARHAGLGAKGSGLEVGVGVRSLKPKPKPEVRSLKPTDRESVPATV